MSISNPAAACDRRLVRGAATCEADRVKRRYRWLLALLWAACDGGPISDFPRAGRGGETPTAAEDQGGGKQDASGEQGDSGGLNGGGASSGTGGTTGEADDTADAGVEGPREACDPRPAMAQEPMPDAGTFAQDAAPDGGISAPAPADAMCAGTLCRWSSEDLAASVVGGACAGDEVGLASACSGALPRAALRCAVGLAQESQRAPAAEAVLACLAGYPKSLAALDCGRCYAEFGQCVVANCSPTGDWAGDDSTELWDCAERSCGADLRACTGLPGEGEAESGAEAAPPDAGPFGSAS